MRVVADTMNKRNLAASAIIILMAAGITANTIFLHQAEAATGAERRCPCPKAPMSTAGENVYTTWWTNKSGNWEVMFRASNDNGATFGDKINLSNSTNADSQDAEIVSSGNNVYVSWWETSTNPANKTSESVLRISNDNGNTFGPILMLGNNGTLTGGG